MLTVEQFVGKAMVVSDPNKLFQEYLAAKRLKNPRATAIELRRLGHIIDYETK